MLYDQMVSEGQAMSPEAVLLYAYGTYLMNGGTKEGFMELNDEDVQIMVTTHMASARRNALVNANSIARIFGGSDQ